MSFQTADQVQQQIQAQACQEARDSAGGGWNNEKEHRAAAARMREEDDFSGGESRKARSHGKALSESFQRLRESLRAQARATFKR